MARPASDETPEQKARREAEDDLFGLFLIAFLAADHEFRLDLATPVEEIEAQARDYAAARVEEILPGIDDVTEERIAKLVADVESGAVAADAAVAEIESGAFWALSPERAKGIAAYEFVRARNLADAAAFEDANIEYVYINDGVDDDEPCIEADGSTWPLAEYEANPLQHPNCRRRAQPIRD